MSVFLRCPCGHDIRGTLETVPGVALGMPRRQDNGTVEMDYEGSTDIDWDGQTTQTKNGKALYLCEGGCIVSEDDLVDPPNDEA